MAYRQKTLGDRIIEIKIVVGVEAANQALKEGWRPWGPSVWAGNGMAFTFVKLEPIKEEDVQT